MKTLLSMLSIISLCLISCVSQSEHDKILIENDSLKKEIYEIKFGAPALLADGKKFYEANDFDQARLKFQLLIDKHPKLSHTVEAKKYLAKIDEEELWHKAKSSEDPQFVVRYIDTYPKGIYILDANARRRDLFALSMQKAYNDCIKINTALLWKNFLSIYPDHIEKDDINTLIIQLEVDEIIQDKNTGEMPSFNQYNSTYSSSSSVEIKNDTGCELVVRYSGPDVEKVIIPIGGKRTVNLSNGKYKIAASACGSNYANSENLHGDYGSTFYITTTRY